MRILEVVNSNTNLNTFRDLGGLEDLLERIKVILLVRLAV